MRVAVVILALALVVGVVAGLWVSGSFGKIADASVARAQISADLERSQLQYRLDASAQSHAQFVETMTMVVVFAGCVIAVALVAFVLVSLRVRQQRELLDLLLCQMLAERGLSAGEYRTLVLPAHQNVSSSQERR